MKSLLSPVVSIMTAGCVALVLWRGAGLILAGAMTAGVLTIFLSYLNKFFKPVQDLAKMTNYDRANRGGRGAHPGDSGSRRHDSGALRCL